jgi:hypothetical protein
MRRGPLRFGGLIAQLLNLPCPVSVSGPAPFSIFNTREKLRGVYHAVPNVDSLFVEPAPLSVKSIIMPDWPGRGGPRRIEGRTRERERWLPHLAQTRKSGRDATCETGRGRQRGSAPGATGLGSSTSAVPVSAFVRHQPPIAPSLSVRSLSGVIHCWQDLNSPYRSGRAPGIRIVGV